MQSIFLAGMIQAIIMFFLLISRSNHYIPNKVLGVLMLIVSAHLFLVMYEGTDFFLEYPHLSRITWLVPVSYGPLILLFTILVTRRRQHFVKTDLLVFLPFLIFFLVLFPYFISTSIEKVNYMNSENGLYSDDFGVINQVANFFHIFFIAAAVIVFRKNIKWWKNAYADPEIVRLNWLINYLFISLFIVLFSVAIFYAKKFNIEPLDMLYPYHFFAVVLMIYWIGYKVLISPEIFMIKVTEPEEPCFEEETRYEAFLLNEDSAKEVQKKIQVSMENDALFKNPDLSLTKLAEHIGISRHHISQVLNVFMKTNFYDLVNKYRVEEFMDILRNPDNEIYTILA